MSKDSTDRKRNLDLKIVNENISYLKKAHADAVNRYHSEPYNSDFRKSLNEICKYIYDKIEAKSIERESIEKH